MEPAPRRDATTLTRDAAPARRLRALLHAAADREDRHDLGREVPEHHQRAAVGRGHGGEVGALELLRRRRLAVDRHADLIARPRRLLPQGPQPAGRGPVRQRADLLGLQLRQGPHPRRRAVDDLPARRAGRPTATWRCRRRAGKDIVTGQFNFDPDEIAYIASHWVHLDHDQAVTASAGVSYRLAARRRSAPTRSSAAACAAASPTPTTCRATRRSTLAARRTDLGGALGKIDGRRRVHQSVRPRLRAARRHRHRRRRAAVRAAPRHPRRPHEDVLKARRRVAARRRRPSLAATLHPEAPFLAC